MDLFAVTLFLIVYYLRPQEWPFGLGAFHFAQIAMLSGLASLFMRDRGIKLRDLFRTPHDWAVLAFWLWIVFTAAAPWTTFKETANLYIFYVVIVQTLHTVPRLNTYVRWWTFLIVAIASLAVLSLYGFDPLSSRDLTMAMKDRLALNLSIFNNPNALGHSVVPGIPLLYYCCIWKKPAISRTIGTVLICLVAYCIYLTACKGAFLTGAAAIVATLAFGRPKAVQVTIIVVALAFGGTLLAMLPRMNELNKSKNDQAIQGRVMAFKHGYKMMTTTDTGVGYHGWLESFIAGKYHFKREKFDKESLKRPMPIVVKASHSSYVCIGAELGYPGFFLHLGILYCCLRTLMTAKTSEPDEERVRRILFALIISYMISSWMVNFEYRPTFFMFAAAAAALHRQLRGLNAEDEERRKGEEAELAGSPATLAWRTAAIDPEPLTQPAWATMNQPPPYLAMATTSNVQAAAPEQTEEAVDLPRPGILWNRIGWIDVAITAALTYAMVRLWAHLISRM